ncbi:MAG: hypothetical protein LBO71_01590 [Prevotellaceae bacterium]|jgi:hypothetical protein|nr:hypothetical protein [Prevotellaceae bacterium]
MATTDSTTKSRVLISFGYALKRLLRNKASYDVPEGFLSELLMRDVKVYSINIIYFDLGQGEDYVYRDKTCFVGLHRQGELQLSAALRHTFGSEEAGDIYPEHYILKTNTFNDVATNTLNEWIYFLKHNAIEDNLKDKGLDKAREAPVRDKLTEEERREYDYLMRVRSENRSAYASAIDEGIIEGELRARKELEPQIAEKERALARALAEKKALAAEMAALKSKSKN